MDGCGAAALSRGRDEFKEDAAARCPAAEGGGDVVEKENGEEEEEEEGLLDVRMVRRTDRAAGSSLPDLPDSLFIKVDLSVDWPLLDDIKRNQQALLRLLRQQHGCEVLTELHVRHFQRQVGYTGGEAGL